MTQPTADQWDWPLQHGDGVVKLINTKDKFEVGLEVPYFTPKEIDVKIQFWAEIANRIEYIAVPFQVKVIGDEVVIHCLHEDLQEKQGRCRREVHRAYKLPPAIDPASVRSCLNQNGILQVTASKKKWTKNNNPGCSQLHSSFAFAVKFHWLFFSHACNAKLCCNICIFFSLEPFVFGRGPYTLACPYLFI